MDLIDKPAVRLEDYQCPPFLVETVALTVELHLGCTRVRARLDVRRNPNHSGNAAFTLDGQGLELVSLSVNDSALPATDYRLTPTALTLFNPPQGAFAVTTETLVNPEANSALTGLYRSGGVYCTQCEAEGFRRITYFPDRPDILATYTTVIIGDAATTPVQLSNGNCLLQETLPDGRRRTVWHDPHPKPCYLFALVAGELACLPDAFTTRSGRAVALAVYAAPEKIMRCAYALEALKRAMRWDEEAFGCEYDLDCFTIVALADFNMGAMENKGLNIFNDSCLLATPETATDQDYERVEAVVAHEYFHNWTGNRITCRDWFQLCLKEGLTVFRDQEFTSATRSRPVKRIADVRALRMLQFPEDAGALAHPVRPESYFEINNFYTATIYLKGAEIIRMLRLLVGYGPFREGMDRYFQRHDGTAATVEDFLSCFLDPQAPLFERFMRWYRQAGTPRVSAHGHYCAATACYELTLRQELDPTPGQPGKLPLPIPVEARLLGPQGELPVMLEDKPFDGLLLLECEAQFFRFSQVAAPPLLSLLRGFSAPVQLALDRTDAELAQMAAQDSDLFNRWQALQTLYMQQLLQGADLRGARADLDGLDGPDYLPQGLQHAVENILQEAHHDPAFAALALTLPEVGEIIQKIEEAFDPERVHHSRERLRQHLARRFGPDLMALWRGAATDAPYSPDPQQAGQRSLRNAALAIACAAGDQPALACARQQFETADNMTERRAALEILAQAGGADGEKALAAFAARHADDPLTMDKWLSIQAALPDDRAIGRVRDLLASDRLLSRNPNRVRALMGSFTRSNPSRFHCPSGRGQRLVTDLIAELDGRNPMLAARLLTAFDNWRKLEPVRRATARQALTGLQEKPLSLETSEILRRLLEGHD